MNEVSTAGTEVPYFLRFPGSTAGPSLPFSQPPRPILRIPPSRTNGRSAADLDTRAGSVGLTGRRKALNG